MKVSEVPTDRLLVPLHFVIELIQLPLNDAFEMMQ